MRHSISVLLCLFASIAVAATLPPEQARADYDLFRKALEEAHSGLHRYTPKAEMDKAFASARAKLDHPMSVNEFRNVLAGVIAKIRCGHSGVGRDEELRNALNNENLFPFRVQIQDEDVVVLTNDTPSDSTIRPGMKVLEINGRKTREILQAIYPLVSLDGEIENGRRYSVARSFGAHYWSVFGSQPEFTIKVTDGSKTLTSKMTGVRAADRTKNAEANPVNAQVLAGIKKINWHEGNLGLRFVQDPDIAEIRIRGFGGGDYPGWMEKTFQTLQEKKTKTLVIDLRGNGGGNDMYGAMLVSYITDKPFRYFDHINMKTYTPSFREHTNFRMDLEQAKTRMQPNPAGGFLVTETGHKGVVEQAPSKYPFMGKVFVLIDGNSFSTTADFCAVAHHLRRATFIGDETGGAYYGNNSGASLTLTLPNSKLPVNIPMWEYWNAVPGYAQKRRGTIPDHQAPIRVADLIAGRDPGLELATKLAAK